MKKILLTLSMTALLLFTAGCSCPFSDKPADSKPQMNTAAASAAEVAPDFSYKELGSGKTMRLSDLRASLSLSISGRPGALPVSASCLILKRNTPNIKTKCILLFSA